MVVTAGHLRQDEARPCCRANIRPGFDVATNYAKDGAECRLRLQATVKRFSQFVLYEITCATKKLSSYEVILTLTSREDSKSYNFRVYDPANCVLVMTCPN